MKTKLALCIITLAGCFLCGNIFAAPPLPGAIWTTDPTCSGVDLNIYSDKHDVYLNGGPAHGTHLPAGEYYVQVTDPSGACVLGTSIGAANEKPFQVNADGSTNCIQLCSTLVNGPDPSCALNGLDPNCGYNDTTNPGGEYKVWVSAVSGFDNDSSKTDNFKVRASGPTPTPTPPTLCVKKFYDANVNGVKDQSECYINGWPFQVFADDNLYVESTTSWCGVVDADSYRVTEGNITNWIHTGVAVNGVLYTGPGSPSSVYPVTLPPDQTVEFGNVCLGAGGGLTLGFWSNKNGQKLENGDDFAMLNALCLRDANGNNADFNGSLTAQRTALNTWLLNANATNMANMLSAQLAAMELNVLNHTVSPAFGVDGTALVYGGDCIANYFPGSNGFITVNALMSAAATELCANGYTPAGNPARAYQECLKTTLDNGNNNLNFVQSQPCSPFTCAQ
jgi:hypothetical protein